MPIRRGSWGLWIACLAALSVSLPIAWISLGKVLVIVAGLGWLIRSAWGAKRHGASQSLPGHAHLGKPLPGHTPLAVVLAITCLALSVLWTHGPREVAILALTKHAKILVIPMLGVLLANVLDARRAVQCFGAGHLFLLGSSFLLALGVAIPWTTDPVGDYVVFSTYLDQSIMFAVSAAVFWHLRDEGLWPRWLGVAVMVLALFAALVLLKGRSGYAVGLVVVGLGMAWLLPRALRLPAVVLGPLLVMALLFTVSDQFAKRVTSVYQETTQFSQKVETDSSSGWRLNAWTRSLQAIQERPVLGHGVGSWAVTIKRVEGERGEAIFGKSNASNPHQEYLLWGVELGVVGIGLLLWLGAAIALDARGYPTGVQRAVWTVLCALGVAALFNSTLYDDLIGDFFCVVLGLLMALGRHLSHPIPPHPTPLHEATR